MKIFVRGWVKFLYALALLALQRLNLISVFNWRSREWTEHFPVFPVQLIIKLHLKGP